MEKIKVEELSNLDRLEGEGSLYKRVMEKAITEDDTEYDVFTYIWLRGVKGYQKTNITPWSSASAGQKILRKNSPNKNKKPKVSLLPSAFALNIFYHFDD